MKELHLCPNGEMVTRTEKFVGMVLADSHQDRANRRTFPDVRTIAEDAMVSERQCQRLLAGLERKGVIRREYPAGPGRGKTTYYFFPELDENRVALTVNHPVEKPSKSSAKGCHDVTLFSGERVTEGCQKGDISSTPIDNREQVQQKQKQSPVVPASGDGVGFGVSVGVMGAALDQVMQGCSFTRRRLRRILQAQLQLALDRGEDLHPTTLAMIAAWKEQARCKGMNLLRVVMGPEKFFGDGHWRNEDGWHWDTQAVERQRSARIGFH